jgi:RNA polymerase subunit RPABC4/transcription elongation factor Spt4
LGLPFKFVVFLNCHARDSANEEKGLVIIINSDIAKYKDIGISTDDTLDS